MKVTYEITSAAASLPFSLPSGWPMGFAPIPTGSRPVMRTDTPRPQGEGCGVTRLCVAGPFSGPRELIGPSLSIPGHSQHSFPGTVRGTLLFSRCTRAHAFLMPTATQIWSLRPDSHRCFPLYERGAVAAEPRRREGKDEVHEKRSHGPCLFLIPHPSGFILSEDGGWHGVAPYPPRLQRGALLRELSSRANIEVLNPEFTAIP